VWRKRDGDMQIYVNLIILFVPCVFSLELPASRDQTERERQGEREIERERQEERERDRERYIK